MQDVLIPKIRDLASGKAVRDEPDLVAALDDLGLIFTTDGGFVRLAEPLELLAGDCIKRQLSEEARQHLGTIEILWEVGSTNTWLLDRAKRRDLFHGVVCMAERQLAGRGRRGRHWVSPFGRNIYLSIGWGLRSQPGPAGLSLVVGMVVTRVLRGIGVATVGLKWPNDILYQGGKLAGILVEIGGGDQNSTPVVIGIGINLGMAARDASQIDQAFSQLGNINCSRNELASRLVDALFLELDRFQTRGFAPYASEWNAYDSYLGTPVKVILPDRSVSGVNRGIDASGNLLLETETGVQAFSAGEVSLRAESGDD